VPPTASDQWPGTRPEARAATTYPASITAAPTTQPCDQPMTSKTISNGKTERPAATRRHTASVSRIDQRPATSATVNAGQA
jgi:hypothetical protein